MNRKAFTMIELVLVMVVIGILAALAIPRLERDLRQEAADNILSAIRYTQHLALLDNKHMFDDPKWHRKFWHIYFGTCDSRPFYAVGSRYIDLTKTTVNIAFEESAIDPANGKRMWANNGDPCSGLNHTISEISPNVLVGKKYGVDTVTGTDGCNGVEYIGFDHLGRPHIGFTGSSKPDYSSYMKQACKLTFTLEEGDPFTITIQPETGYAQIVGQDGS